MGFLCDGKYVGVEAVGAAVILPASSCHYRSLSLLDCFEQFTTASAASDNGDNANRNLKNFSLQIDQEMVAS